MPSGNEYAYRYDTNSDIYCYPDSTVLINKFDIRDKDALHSAERRITALKITELESNPIKGDYDLSHLQAIHKFIFSDIYDWAGQIRQGDFLIKGDSLFCRAMYIESLAAEVHSKLKKENYLCNLEKNDFITRLAYYMGEINAVHPFREGNGRASRLLFKELCRNAGYTLEFRKTNKDTLVKADILAFNREYGLLIDVLNEIVSK